MRLQILTRRIVVTMVLAGFVASACGSAAAAPQWTYSPVSSAAAGASVAPSAGPTPSATTVPSVAPTVAATASGDIPITLSEWKAAVQPNIKAGIVNLQMSNFGTVEHELLVFKSDLAAAAYPVDKAGDIIEDDPSIALVSDGKNIVPAGTQARSLDLTAPGTYLFVCNIPGHFKQGMFTVVTVTP